MWPRLFVILALTFWVGSCGPLMSAIDGGPIVVCPKDNFTKGCDVDTIGKATGYWAQFNRSIVIRAGTYREAFTILDHGVTIRAEPGVHIKDRAVEGKAAILVKGNNTVIEGLECSGISVADGNGACVKLEGRNLTLRNVYFHDSEQGLLTNRDAGTIIIEQSKFERLGRKGRGHAIYVGYSDALIVRGSQILSSKDQGHEIKSRAAETIIENSIIASLDGDDSRLIDISNGGRIIIRNNILEEGPRSKNDNLIAIAPEGTRYKQNEVIIEGNIIIMDHDRAYLLRLPEQDLPVTLRNNIIVGGEQIEGDNTWFPDREAAGFPAYPALPPLPSSGSEMP